MDDIVRIILEARKNEKTTISCKFSIMDNISLYTQLGIPIMHHDQLNIITKYISGIKEDDGMSILAHQTYLNNIYPQLRLFISRRMMKIRQRKRVQHAMVLLIRMV